MLRELRDGVSSLTAYQAGQRGGPSLVGKSGQVRIEEKSKRSGRSRDRGSRVEAKKTMNIVPAV